MDHWKRLKAFLDICTFIFVIFIAIKLSASPVGPAHSAQSHCIDPVERGAPIYLARYLDGHKLSGRVHLIGRADGSSITINDFRDWGNRTKAEKAALAWSWLHQPHDTRL